MESSLQDQIAFYLTGRRPDSLQPIDERFRPALLARYADLTSLRYDLPLVLNRGATPQWAVLSLSHLVDDAIGNISSASESLRIARHGYRLERELRRQLSGEAKVDFAAAWKKAVKQLAAEGDDGIQSSADILWSAFQASGDLIDAGADLPKQMLHHAWAAIQREKSKAFHRRADHLSHVLRGILAAETLGSAAGRAPDRLKAGVGSTFADAFDFDAMSNILAAATVETRLSDQRRRRITDLLGVLSHQRFFPLGEEGPEAYPFDFQSCSEALAAYNERYPAAVELSKTLAIAELEAAGEYREAIHDVIFDSFGANGLDSNELGQLPDYLVCTNGASQPAELDRLLQLLAAGVPFKVLLQTDDVFEPSGIAKGHASFASRASSVVNAAIGFSDVFVLQATVSQLYSEMSSLLSGLTYDGPALFSVFSGANENNGDIPAYLVAAAAVESRVFPTVIYDPSTGDTRAERLSVRTNPQADKDWPVYSFGYEGAHVEALFEDAVFTAADLMAMDKRFTSHFALASPEADVDSLITITEACDLEISGLPDKVPYIPVVDIEGNLRRAVIDDRMLQDVRRCLQMWRGLSTSDTVIEAPVISAAGTLEIFSEAPISEPAQEMPAIAPPADQPDTGHGDDAYIETERCTTCNECTILNNRMFAYNENKQAFVADPDAGTFRQLVEAAEGCQVSIIHPGKPRNLKEPGLEDLIRRAAEFN